MTLLKRLCLLFTLFMIAFGVKAQTGKLMIDVFPIESVVLMNGDTIPNRSLQILEAGSYTLTASAPGREPFSGSVNVYAGATNRWAPSLKTNAAYDAYMVEYNAWKKKKNKNTLLKVSMLVVDAGFTAFAAGYLPFSANKKIKAANDAQDYYLQQINPDEVIASRQDYLQKREAANDAISKRNRSLYISLPILAVAYGLTVVAWVKAPKPGPEPNKNDFGVVSSFKLKVFPNIFSPSQSQAGISFNF